MMTATDYAILLELSTASDPDYLRQMFWRLRSQGMQLPAPRGIVLFDDGPNDDDAN